MIDFRYHLVTVIAIFLALAIGIVVGTTALNGAVVSNLHHDVAGLQSEKARLLAANDTAAAVLSLDTAFARELEPLLLDQRLAGRRVAVVGLPGASRADRDAAASLVTSAGGRVVAEIGFTSTVLDPSSGPLLTAVSQDTAPTGVSLPNGSPAAAAATVLAAALTGKPSAGSRSGDPSPELVTSAFASYHLLVEDVRPRTTAAMELLVAPAGPGHPPAAGSAQQTAAAAATLSADLAQALAGDGAAVTVTGPGSAAGPGGLIGGVRAALPDGAAVSTVDGSETPQGQIATVFALLAASRGVTGSYGVQPGETPLPAASASPSASP